MMNLRSKSFRPVALVLLLVLTGCSRSVAPVIGISSGWDRGRVDVSDAYAFAVRVVLPPVLSFHEAVEVLSHVDALILTGGEDVDPARYGEDIWNETVEVNYRRDTSDFLLAHVALDAELPILGICRGEQLMNVALGGSLYQDLPTQFGSGRAIFHRQSEPDGVGTHMIYLSAESRLREILGADSLMVNSFHHQAVKEPGTGVAVVARSADGVVEAWESKGIVCVQFHPELMIKAGDTTFLPIFEDLVARSR